MCKNPTPVTQKLIAGIALYGRTSKSALYELYSFLMANGLTLFKSDFKDVAKFFVAQRTRADINFSSKQIKHVDEVLKLLQAATGEPDNSELFIKDFEKGEKTVMGNLFKRYENKGLRQGLEQGRAEGKIEGKLEGMMEAAKSLIESSVPVVAIMQATGLSMEKLQELSQQVGVALVQ